jgi:peptidoglycan/xylan/chitin deacetylase (PgdA/CDA1 family)
MSVEAFKALAKRLAATSPGWALSRLVRPPGTLVLMYHRVGPNPMGFPSLALEAFREQMTWLKTHCTPLGAEELRASVDRPNRSKPFALVTFDDGYRDYFEHAYPILKELGIPALVFLSTVFMDDPGRLLWPDLLHLAAHRAPGRRVRLPFLDEEIELGGDGGRRRLVRAIKDHVKELPEDLKESTLLELLRVLDVHPSQWAIDRPMLSWDEVRAAQDLTTWGGHTHTHPILSRISKERVEEEVRTCRDRIKAETGLEPRHFAYPNGRYQDFDDDTKAVLRRYGFDVAYSVEEGCNDATTDWMAVRRLAARSDLGGFAWALGRASR